MHISIYSRKNELLYGREYIYVIHLNCGVKIIDDRGYHIAISNL